VILSLLLSLCNVPDAFSFNLQDRGMDFLGEICPLAECAYFFEGSQTLCRGHSKGEIHSWPEKN